MAKKQVAVSLRKPPSPEKVESFVAGGASEKPAAPTEGRGARVKSEPAPRSKQGAASGAPSVEAPKAEAPKAEVSEGPKAEVSEGPKAEVSEGPKAEVSEGPKAEVSEGPKAEVSEAPKAEVSEASVPAVTVPAVDALAALGASGELQPLATTAEPPATPVLVGSDGRVRRAFTVYLPNHLADRLVLHCIEQDRDMSNLIGEAIEVHLDRRLGPGPSAESPSAEPPPAPREPAPAGGEPFHASEPFRSEPFRSEPFHASEPGSQGRIDRFLQVGRVLVTLWRQRPWGG
jgi:hypothetical protein